MIQYAFKIASKTGDPWSNLVARASGYIYSHIAVWLNGERNAAYCFSSREPHGAGFQTIDITSDMWDVLPLNCTSEQEKIIWGFCLGADGKMYDGIGLLGFGKEPAIHDYHALHCSETGSAIAQKCCGKTLPKDPWMISPGELYELLKRDFK